MSEIVNARITSTMLGVEDHGILTAYITLDYGGSGQSFGGYAMDRYNKETKRREGHAFGAEYILRLLETLDVKSWEKLPGTHCRVRIDGGLGGLAHAIGNILRDKWFDPKLLAEGYEP